jgi:hypothetical protein
MASEKLTELERMRANNLITEDEYKAKREEILRTFSAPVSPVVPVVQYQAYIPAKQYKDKGITMVLEILPGLFGFYGIGWIYAGNSSRGAALLICGILWDIFAIVLASVTAGFSACLSLPVSVLVLVLSAVSLNTYTKQHPETFGVQ